MQQSDAVRWRRYRHRNHACHRCWPYDFPDELRSPTRTSEGHVGVRFGDREGRGGWSWRVTVDGVDVMYRTVEAVAGDDGWVLLIRKADNETAHLAHCMRHVCMELRRGRVEITHTRRAAA